MELLSPWSLAWLGLLAPLVALYVLKRRRARKVVASTMLWEAALRDMRAERQWQRLRPHLALLLQALALVLGALALARPTGGAAVPTGARVAVVIDVSASMAARAEEGTRLSIAIREARALARDLPPAGAMMVIAAGAEADVLAPLTSDRAVLERALDELRVRGARADLPAAVALAAERLEGAPEGSRVLVFTDAAISSAVPLEASVPVEVRRVGDARTNVAITALDVRARPEPEAPDRAEVFVRVARFGEGSGEVRVSASIEGGALLSTRRLRVAAGTPEAIVMSADLPPDADGRGAVVRVAIEAIGEDDPLALDDVAVAPSPAARRLPVFLIGGAPASVERVLSADPDVELYRADRSALGDRELDGLFVYTGEAPDELSGDAIVVAPRGSSVFGVELGGAVERPAIVSWDETDPRLRFVQLSDVHLGEVRPITGAAARAVVTTDAGVAVAALERSGVEATILALDPDRGDWPSRPGFVVFFRNLLERARARRAEGGVAQGELGAPLRVMAEDGAAIEARTPSGRVFHGRATGDVAMIDVPAEPGAYRVRIGTRERLALRSLLDAEESDLSPRASFTQRDERALVATSEVAQHREAWPWLGLALLILLVLEALWATRKQGAA